MPLTDNFFHGFSVCTVALGLSILSLRIKDTVSSSKTLAFTLIGAFFGIQGFDFPVVLPDPSQKGASGQPCPVGMGNHPFAGLAHLSCNRRSFSP